MKDSSLNLDTKFLYETEGKTDGYFIKNETSQRLKSHADQSLAEIEKNISAGKYDFIEDLRDDSYLKSVKNVFSNVSWAQYMVVVGIGGSDLGGRTVIEAFMEQDSPTQVLFTGDSTDPVAFARILDKIDLSQTVFNIVSKSGGTLETLSAYAFFKAEVGKITDNWQRHFVFTTSGVSGVLKKEAQENNVITLPVPEGVGGRFSVLTPVGLLPALAVGVDIDALVAGGLDFARNEKSRELAAKFATSQYELYEQGIKISVMMVYSVQLQEFARWFRQLWAESLGKDDKGILPVKAWGPADQHSQGQFYNQGTPMQSVLFVKVENREVNFTLSDLDIDEAKYLESVDFNKIVNIECDASAESLFNHGRPSAMLSIERLDARALGELFMFFQLAVVYLAQMLGVNAFDQPGVEEGKRIMNAALGK